MKKLDKPVFAVGDVVYAPSFSDDSELVITNVRHTGITWMYSFANCGFMLGESYLTRFKPVKTMRELVLDRIKNNFGVSNVDPNISDSDMLNLYTDLVLRTEK